MLTYFTPHISSKTILDPYFPYVMDLFNYDISVTQDSSIINRGMSPTGSVAQSNTVIKFGSGSLYVPGGTNNYSNLVSGSYQVATGNFTLEFWFYPITWPNDAHILFNSDSSGGNNKFIIQRDSSNNRMKVVDGADRNFPSTLPSTNTWHHFVLERSGSGTNNCKAYVDGNLEAQWTQTSETIFNLIGATFGGRASKPSFHGYLDELRFTNGVARYGGSTPPVPTSKFPTKGKQVTSITMVASATSNTANITIPATAQPGDWGVLCDVAVGTSSQQAPSGWDILSKTNGNAGSSTATIRGGLTHRILTSGDPGSTITGVSGATNNGKVMLIFRPDNPISNIFQIKAGLYEWTTSNPAAQSVFITGASYKCAQVMLGAAGSNLGTSAFSTMTPYSWDATVRSNGLGNVLFGYAIDPGKGTGGIQTVDMNDLGSNFLFSGTYFFA